MRAAVIGRVEAVDVSGPDHRIIGDHRLDRAVHRAQMHRHVRRVGDERAGLVEEAVALFIEHGIDVCMNRMNGR